jgi:ABC-2 type transport system permease protein
MFFRQLRNELWKLFGKKRTYLGFSVLAAVQLAIVLRCYFDPLAQRRIFIGGGGEEFSSLTCAAVMTLPIALILLPLFLALVGGDLVAKEVEDGTMRMVLARPISRIRMLTLKWIAGVMFGAVIVLALGGFGLAAASVFFPWGGMYTFVPGVMFAVFDPGTGLERYAGAHLLMMVEATTLISLAFMFSCMNMRPAAATVLAVAVVFADRMLHEMPFFADMAHWFLTPHLNCWRLVLTDPVPGWRILSSACVLAGYNATFLIVGLATFNLRDIKS